jgi:hypothetical protein
VETKKYLSWDSRCPDRDSKQTPLEWKSRSLPLDKPAQVDSHDDDDNDDDDDDKRYVLMAVSMNSKLLYSEMSWGMICHKFADIQEEYSD